AAHAGDVRAGVAHEREIVCGQPAGERDEQPRVVRFGHPRGELARRNEPTQARPDLVRRIEQHTLRAGARRDLDEIGGREARGAVRVGVSNRDDAAVTIGHGFRAAHRRRGERRDAPGAGDPGEADLHQRRAGCDTRPGSALDRRLVARVAQRGGEWPLACDGGVDLVQHFHGHRAERAGQRIFRVDHVGTARERGRRLRRARHAHQQSHRGLLYHLVIWSSRYLVIGYLNEAAMTTTQMTKWPDDRMSRFMVPAPLAGRAVLVTGGSSGIGRAIALACARAGADVALTFRANETGAQEEGGVIVNMSWDHALTGMPGLNPQLFAAVKGAVLAFSKSLARSVAPRVRVNVLAPGWIETSFAAGLNEGMRNTIAESTPLKRWGTPDEVAGAAVFLASPAAAFLTGQTILVNGGVVM